LFSLFPFLGASAPNPVLKIAKLPIAFVFFFSRQERPLSCIENREAAYCVRVFFLTRVFRRAAYCIRSVRIFFSGASF